MSQSNFARAKQRKNDEFYTQLPDIEKELRHYRDDFRDKVVFCNCDDPYESNFFKYFAANFNFLGLKKLITTSYNGSPVAGDQLPLLDIEGLKPHGKQPFVVEINEVPDTNNDGAIDLDDVEYLLRNDANSTTPLHGNGDFRSDESIDYLKQADIVVTNPPFSLFREYVAQLVEYSKRFLIIGNTNALTYRDIFKLIQEDRFRTGFTNFNVGMFFVVPDDTEKFHRFDGSGNKLVRVSTSCWFTNLEVSKHKQDISLYRTYTPDQYPTYANYDAIEVSRVAETPTDYPGEMGVPITFLDKYNPDQFEIIGSSRTLGRPMSEIAQKGTYMQGGPRFYLEKPHEKFAYTRLYDRLVIKHRKEQP